MVLAPEAHGISSFHVHPVAVIQKHFLCLRLQLFIYRIFMQVAQETAHDKVGAVYPAPDQFQGLKQIFTVSRIFPSQVIQ